MNQVSKLLILLQLFLSIMFMAFAAAVYQAGTNWKTSAAKASESLKNARGALKESQDSRDQLVANHAGEVKAAKEEAQVNLATANQLQIKLNELLGVEGGAVGQFDKAKTAAEEARAEAKIATDEAAARRAEATALRDEVRKLRGQVATLVAESRVKDDQILEKTGQLAAAIAKDKNDQSEIARLSTLVRLNGLNPRARIDASGALAADGREPVEYVNGKVKATRRSRSGSIEFVHISLDKDDAIEVGNKLHIYRGSKFVADIKLIEVTADGAVGVVDEKLRNGIIRRDDNVTSKL